MVDSAPEQQQQRVKRIATLTKPPIHRIIFSIIILVVLVLLPLFQHVRFLVNHRHHEEHQVIFGRMVSFPYANFDDHHFRQQVAVVSTVALEPVNDESLTKKSGQLDLLESTAETASGPNSVFEAIQTTKKPVVLHFPAHLDDGIEMRMELDGLMGSNAVHLINTSMLQQQQHSRLVWIGSPTPRRRCNMKVVKQVWRLYNKENMTTTTTNWTFHLLDWGDRSDQLLRCEDLEMLVGEKNVHYWKRSIVFGRRWNVSTQSIELGRVSTDLEGVQEVRPLHLSTRADIVQGIAATVATLTNRTIMMTAQELSEYVVTKERPGDVIHHWPAYGRGVNRGSRKGRNDLLRTATSLTLENMTLPPYNLADVFCGTQGNAKEQGRRGTTSNHFVESILRYKIMVVSQRDSFEGHLRLFEGLVSGAMVLHDRMISLPVGLKENVNIVFYDNQDELREKVMYYLKHTDERLAIARRGRRLAMCESRTWHRMEQIILGRTVTSCDE